MHRRYTQKSPNPYDPSLQQIWLKGPMSDGDYAIAFVNTTNSSAAYAQALEAQRPRVGVRQCVCQCVRSCRLRPCRTSGRNLHCGGLVAE